MNEFSTVVERDRGQGKINDSGDPKTITIPALIKSVFWKLHARMP